MRLRHFIFLLVLSLQAVSIEAHDKGIMPLDTIVTPKKKNFVDRLIGYFNESNKPKADGRFDFSVIGGPHYSSEQKFGIGLVAAANYNSSPFDSLTPGSNIELFGDISSVGFYMLGIRGNHITRADRMRLVYNLKLYSFATKFWGIGYKMGADNSNKTDFNEFRTNGSASLLFNTGHNLYSGPGVDITYVNASKVERPALWIGQKLRILSPGLTLTAQYDTRDNLTAPEHGWLVSILQSFYPRFLGNKYAFSATEASANCYYSVWRGGVIASRIHSRWAYGEVPWTMMSTLGGSHTMRGYYEGRYNDKFEADLTVELRQKVWHRSGIALWLGIGAVAHDPGKIKFKELLPNVGIGYRWEFKQHTNVRLDFGVGRHTTGFIFNINEAF